MKSVKYLRPLLGTVLLLGSLSLITTTFLAHTVVATPSNSSVASVTPSPSMLGDRDPLQAAMEKTKRQQYAEAIAILKTGEQKYRQQGKESEAYASQVLIIKLQEELHDQRKPGGVARAESATLIGRCLDAEDCHYSLEWYAPEETSKKYGGILILSKEVGKYSHGAQGLSAPIWGIMDIKVVPALGKNEIMLSECMDKSQKTIIKGMLGIVTVPDNIPISPAVLTTRKAWLANLGWGEFQELIPANTICELHLP
jgi:hypothetical protein